MAACDSDASDRAASASRSLQSYPAHCVAGPVPDASPSREGFLREILFARRSVRTASYAYTEGSYDADKVEIAQGLPLEAARCGVTLDGLLLIGPVGPLWTYHAIAFIHDDDSIRVNSLVMPHARITGKATGTLAVADAEDFYSAITDSSLQKGLAPSGGDPEWEFQILFARFVPGGPRYWHGSLGRGSSATAVFERRTNGILGAIHETYPEARLDTLPPEP